MAKRKLTLSVDGAIIERAKRFSERHDTTVSQLVTNFLASLEGEEERVTPVVAGLRGVLPPSVSREARWEYLRRKHAS